MIVMDDAKNLVYGFIIQSPMGEKKSEVRAERPASKSSACSHRGIKVEFDGIAEVIVRFNRVPSGHKHRGLQYCTTPNKRPFSGYVMSSAVGAQPVWLSCQPLTQGHGPFTPIQYI
jgi:hypothetical protein